MSAPTMAITRPSSHRSPITLAAALLVLGAAPVHAQRVGLTAGIASTLTWSNNAELGTDTEAGSDTALDVRPRIDLRIEGARLRLSGSAAVSAIAYANRSQPNRLLPEVDVDASLQAIPRRFIVDAGVRASQTSQNLFGARPESSSTRNALTTAQAHLSPRIEGEAGSHTRYRLRSENVRTKGYGEGADAVTTSGNGYYGRHSVLLERDPVPLGFRLEAQRSRTTYEDSFQDDLTEDLARASITLALGDQVTVGLRGGAERNSYLDDDARRIHGVEASWHPSERTLLSAFGEKRFFGTSWRLAFDHRMPWLAWSLLVSRGLESAPQSLFELPPSSNVPQLLDAMLTTRVPDPFERDRMVQDIMARQGLPSSTLTPISVNAQRLSLVSLSRANVAFNGVRGTLAFSAFHSRTEDALTTGPLATNLAFNNNAQRGGSVTFSYRVTRTAAATAVFDWSRVTSLVSGDDSRSRQQGVRAQMTHDVLPRTQAVWGARYRKLDSNTVSSGDEAAAFAGLNHTF